MADKEQINLRVDPAQKERWQSHVEQSDQFVTLSGLIRTSVETTLQDDEHAEATPSPAVASDIQRLQEELTEVRKNVAWVREQFQDDVDIAGIAQEGFDALEPLPEPPSPVQVPDDVDMDYDEYQRHLQAAAVIDPDGSPETRPQTAAAIAERVGTTPKRVEDAIEYLEDQFLPVVTIEYDGERHYFTEE